MDLMIVPVMVVIISVMIMVIVVAVIFVIMIMAIVVSVIVAIMVFVLNISHVTNGTCTRFFTTTTFTMHRTDVGSGVSFALWLFHFCRLVRLIGTTTTRGYSE